MDTKLIARIGAGAFFAVVLIMTALQLHDEPKAPQSQTIIVAEPDGDPLPAQLRACANMGELALSSPDCRAAWAEKRRRFLGAGRTAGGAAIPPPGSSPLPKPQPAKGQ
ncbi:putative entry exclusion protein TrbK-alt [Novosphingobium sp. LASN5T]|uniref:putative entry exclusion protein TrbK-alt n=1 Tax=Novosphingobium sp. LASN5T TaxID=2491021 RepID=UPI000F5FCEB3|nr:putative entry exclusion protein TrbK-alt [Novosphingobium sp. LASN5T]RQW42256.1 hypothetical protein EH199_18570 [Novosphingobium sp. LASN5T]